MNRFSHHRTLVCVFFFLFAFAAASAAFSQSDDETSPLTGKEILETLGWLHGDWRGPTQDGATWEARYTTADGGLILSVNKKIVQGRVKLFEFEKFEAKRDEVILTPFPYGKESPAKFTLAEFDPSKKKAVFVNPKHDFPQRIVYDGTEKDRLVIEVTAERDGRTVGFRLDLKRRQTESNR